MRMTTLWIAVSAVVLAAGAIGWMRARAHQKRSAGPKSPLPGPGSTSVALDETAGRATDVSASHAGLASLTDVITPEPERLILQRLCVGPFAGTPMSPAAPLGAQASAEAAAIETLAGIRAHPRYIPRRPQLLPQLTRAINDPDATAQSIAAILRQDPALAGNLLRIANSVMYRRQAAPIEDLERAVARLGTEGLRQTVMAALLQPVITDDGSVFARCAARLWDHTLLSAQLAARPVDGASRDDLHATQLLALLHGLGAVVVLQVLRDSWGRAGAGSPDHGTLVALLETWSARCARAFSADWGLSERVQDALEELAADAGAAAEDEALRGLVASLRLCRTRAAAELSDA